MRIVTDDNTRQVHLLGLGWRDVAVLTMSLTDSALATSNAELRARCDAMIELLDAATENHINAYLDG